tara:strand:+ start:26 stop:694 length:669 start_codon:yes stop_codon:yes gene_type:complete
MKITKSQLKQIIKEEMSGLVYESGISDEALTDVHAELNAGNITFAKKLAGNDPDALEVIRQWEELMADNAAAQAERSVVTPEDELPEPYYAIPPRSGLPPGNVSEQELKRFINEEIEFIIKEGILDTAKPEVAAATAPDDTKLNRKTANKGKSVADAKAAMQGDSAELSNPERGIIQQLIAFLLKIAQVPGVEFQMKRPIIQKVMKILQTRIMQGVEVNNDG